MAAGRLVLSLLEGQKACPFWPGFARCVAGTASARSLARRPWSTRCSSSTRSVVFVVSARSGCV
eukprot:10275356-Lingulodinium_polyedra.AAC.1